jgi:hypothetical protein
MSKVLASQVLNLNYSLEFQCATTTWQQVGVAQTLHGGANYYFPALERNILTATAARILHGLNIPYGNRRFAWQ